MGDHEESTPLVRRLAGVVARAALFSVVFAAGLSIVWSVAAGRHGWQHDHVILFGGIAAWSVALWFDERTFGEDMISVRFAQEQLRSLHDKAIERIEEAEGLTRKSCEDLERYSYLRGVRDACTHPERVNALLAEVEAEESR